MGEEKEETLRRDKKHLRTVEKLDHQVCQWESISKEMTSHHANHPQKKVHETFLHGKMKKRAGKPGLERDAVRKRHHNRQKKGSSRSESGTRQSKQRLQSNRKNIPCDLNQSSRWACSSLSFGFSDFMLLSCPTRLDADTLGSCSAATARDSKNLSNSELDKAGRSDWPWCTCPWKENKYWEMYKKISTLNTGTIEKSLPLSTVTWMQSINLSTIETLYHWVDRSINQSLKHYTIEWIDQSINHWNTLPLSWSINQSIYRLTYWSSDRSNIESSNRSFRHLQVETSTTSPFPSAHYPWEAGSPHQTTAAPHGSAQTHRNPPCQNRSDYPDEDYFCPHLR